jgi:hypothetical protein
MVRTMSSVAIVRSARAVTDDEAVTGDCHCVAATTVKAITHQQLIVRNPSPMGGAFCRPLPRANQRQSRSGGVSDPPSRVVETRFEPGQGVAHAPFAGPDVRHSFSVDYDQVLPLKRVCMWASA